MLFQEQINLIQNLKRAQGILLFYQPLTKLNIDYFM
jgi:hypothetical protein